MLGRGQVPECSNYSSYSGFAAGNGKGLRPQWSPRPGAAALRSYKGVGYLAKGDALPVVSSILATGLLASSLLTLTT